MKIQSYDLSSLLGNSFPPLFSPLASNGEPISIHPPPGQTALIPEKSISTSFQLTWHPAARVSQLEPLRPVDARCGKKRLYGCISVWLTLLWDARVGEDVPPDGLQKRVFSSLSGTVRGPGLSREAAFAQDYRTVGWRRINKVRMTVSSSRPEALEEIAGAVGRLASRPSRVRLWWGSFHPGGGD